MKAKIIANFHFLIVSDKKFTGFSNLEMGFVPTHLNLFINLIKILLYYSH